MAVFCNFKWSSDTDLLLFEKTTYIRKNVDSKACAMFFQTAFQTWLKELDLQFHWSAAVCLVYILESFWLNQFLKNTVPALPCSFTASYLPDLYLAILCILHDLVLFLARKDRYWQNIKVPRSKTASFKEPLFFRIFWAFVEQQPSSSFLPNRKHSGYYVAAHRLWYESSNFQSVRTVQSRVTSKQNYHEAAMIDAAWRESLLLIWLPFHVIEPTRTVKEHFG